MLKPDRITSYWRINLLIFAVSVIVMLVISSDIDRYMEDGVFYVYPKRIYGNMLTSRDISRLENIFMFTDTYMSFESVGGASIQTELMTAFSKVLYTSPDYVYMNRMVFTDGWYFTEHQERMDVIVLSEALAWKLFGDTRVVGDHVMISDVEYEVVGVVAQKNIGENNYFAWQPLNRYNSGAYAESLYVQPADYDKIAGYRLVSDAIADIPKDVRNYQITDISEYILSISRRPVIGLSLFGIYIICVLAMKAVGVLRPQAKEKSGWRGIIRFIVYAATIVVIFLFVDLDIWVPGWGAGGLKQLYITFTNAGLLPSSDYLSHNLLSLKNLNAYSNAAFTASAFSLVNMVFMTKSARMSGGTEPVVQSGGRV